MKKVLLIIGLVIMCTLLTAQQVPRDKVVVEIGTGGWCQYCPGAAMGADDLVANGHEVAIIENHNGDPYATTFSNARNSYYGITGYPTAFFDGIVEVGGGSQTNSMYSSYLPRVNQRLAINSSFTIDLEVDGGGTGMEANIIVEKVAAYTGTNLVLHFVATESEIPYNWFGLTEFNFVSRAMVPDHLGTSLDFTSGDIQTFSLPFTFGADWILEHCEFIAFIQDNSTKEILQGTKTQFTGLLPMFGSNVTEGPAYFGVQFTSNSLPQTGIESWEWDFDGDGVFDSTQENPYHLYTEPGVYDVTLKIGVDGEYAEVTVADYITATDGSSVSGNLSGAWVSNFSPYTISGDIEIAEGDELMINPDVELIFDEDVQFTVNGLLVADASSTRNNPIVFTSESSWNGIRFFNTLEDNVLANCEISNASVSAIKVEGDSKVDVIGCKIFDNNTTSLASIEIVGSENVIISQNIIANNTSSSNAGSIACTTSSVEITNNVIVNNTGQWGAFSFKNDSNPIMTNNTIANNLSTNTTPYMIFLLNSVPIITNSIIIDNSEIYFPQSTPEITYSCVTGGFTGEGNIDEDPLFAAPTAGDGTGYDGLIADWSLQAGSLCINAGNPDAMYNDVDGSRNDMGAFGGPTPYELEPTSSDDNTVNIVAINSISVYPNPFNPIANIALSINENDLQQPVSVEIFNIKGQLVKTIVNNEIVQTTNFVWNGKDNNNNSTSSGMYFVKMKTVSSEVSKKMILMK